MSERTELDDIREALADYDRTKTKFDALYRPWARRLFAHPMPVGYTNALDQHTAATEVIEEGAAGRIRFLLSLLDAGKADPAGATPPAEGATESAQNVKP